MAKRILILGGGVAGAQVLKQVHKHFHSDDNYSITVVDKNNFSTFIPMLHEVATGSVSPQHISHPIRQILHCCLEHFVKAEVLGIDLEQKKVKTSVKELEYDYLVVALGSITNYFGVPGAKKHCMDLKTFDDAITLRRRLLDRFEEASLLPPGPERSALLSFVIIGGGYTGVETAGQIADLFKSEFADLYGEITVDEPRITLVQGGDRILPTLSEESSRKATKRLDDLGVDVITGTRATAITEKGVSLDNGKVISSTNVVWASGIYACGEKFFDKDLLMKGRVIVNDRLQIPSHPEVFVIGDMAAIDNPHGPDPQTAQAAVEHAHTTAINLRRLTHRKPLKTFKYFHKGDLVPIGNGWAIAEVFGMRFYGFIGWWLRRTVYLKGLFSFSDRVKVVFDWTMNLFTARDTTRF